MTSSGEVSVSARPLIDHLFLATSGPRNARVVLVGEAWGREEAHSHSPFVGASGKELNRMLSEAGLDRASVLCTNVISEQPPNNDFGFFCYENSEVKKNLHKGVEYHGIYPHPNLLNGINRLWALLDSVNPDLVIVAGNIPLHILTPHATVKTVGSKPSYSSAKRSTRLPAGITSWRGSQTWSRKSPAGKTYRVLPIIHPAAILREWSFRSITVHDLRSRAARFLAKSLSWDAPSTNDIWRPTFGEVETLLNTWIARACFGKFWLSVDLETYKQKFITVVGLCDETVSLCIPFFYFDDQQRSVNYWTLEEEIFIWKRLKTLLENPNAKIVGQNFIYDTQFLQRHYGISAIVSFDSMVMHHLLYPGTPKALHRLASLYNHYYCYWKDESGEWDTNALAASDLWKYNCKDTRATLEAAKLLWSLILKRPGYAEHYKWRMEEWQLARQMSIEGINYDNKLRADFQARLYRAAERIQGFLLACVPESARYSSTGTPWYDSPTALMDLLYRRLGFAEVKHKTTKRPTSDDSAINELIERKECKWFVPVLNRIRALRSIGVYNSHFLDVKLGPRGRLYTQFNIAHPETFRWSSMKNPFNEGSNLQNVPKVEID